MPNERLKPTLQEWVDQRHLYVPLAIGDDEEAILYVEKLAIETGDTVTMYCPVCHNESIFRRVFDQGQPQGYRQHHSRLTQQIEYIRNTRLRAVEELRDLNEAEESAISKAEKAIEAEFSRAREYHTSPRFIEIELQCTRNTEHRALLVLLVQGKKLTKIGQYPSQAELDNSDIKRYRGLLGEEKYSEMRRAMDLRSRGINAGALLYIRRIYEHLLAQAIDAAVDDTSAPDLTEEAFREMRVKEKVTAVKEYLPAQSLLAEKPELYGILSMGVHTLSEGECEAEYPVAFMAIKVILEQTLSEKLISDARQDAEKAITKRHSAFSDPGKN